MKKINLLLIGFIFVLQLSLPVMAIAQSSTTILDTPTSDSPQTTSDTGVNNLRVLTCGKHDDSTFFGLPTWYKYLGNDEAGCPTVVGVEGIWAIVIAVIEFMLRLAVYVSIGLVIWGGIKMIMSQGEPENFSNARKIIQNSLIGLGITMVATGIITFIGSQFKG